MRVPRSIAIAAGVVALIASGATTAAAEPSGSSYYVDCSASGPGAGSHAAPWDSLAQANAHQFGPGDRLLFKRGSTCVGMLTPHGSGSADRPFVISDYGDAASRAVIDGDGAEAAVKIFNDEHIELTNLGITNARTPSSQRRGVLVQLQDFGTGTGYELRNLAVHDVLGGDLKGPNGSQGIAFKITGSSVPTSFDDVHIVGNRLNHIDRQAILVAVSSWSQRPEVNQALPDNWLPSTHVVVERNTITDIGGDGIVMNTTQGAVVQRNTVSGFNKRSAGYNAGIWDYNTNDTLFQYNDVSGGYGHLDGMAYDVDQGNINTTFQYNYSHDNDGGFFLLCNNGPGLIRNAVVRDNFSRNDSFRGIENCRGAIESASFTGNTIYIGDGIDQTVVNENTPSVRHVRFERNIVYKTGSGVATFRLRSGGYTFARNIFVGVHNAPQQTQQADITGACAPGAATGFPAVESFAYRTAGARAAFADLGTAPDLRHYFGATSHTVAGSGHPSASC